MAEAPKANINTMNTYGTVTAGLNGVGRNLFGNQDLSIGSVASSDEERRRLNEIGASQFGNVKERQQSQDPMQNGSQTESSDGIMVGADQQWYDSFMTTIAPFVNLTDQEKKFYHDQSGIMAANGIDSREWAEEFLTINGVANATGLSRDEVITHKDELLEYFTGEKAPHLNFTNGGALINAFVQGVRQQELATLKDDYRRLMANGFDEESEEAKAKLNDINQQLEKMSYYQDVTPHNWVINTMSNVISQIPYQLVGEASGFAGGTLGGAIGSIFGSGGAIVGRSIGSYLSRFLTYAGQFAGDAYWNMREAGLSNETALKYSAVDGLINGLNEALLDKVSGDFGEITGLKKSLYPGFLKTFKSAEPAKFGLRMLWFMGTEGAGEFLQEGSESLTSSLLLNLALYNNDKQDNILWNQSQLKDALDEAVQGFVCGTVFGLGNGVVSGALDYRTLSALKDRAGKTLSKDSYVNNETYRQALSNLRLNGEALSEADIDEALGNLWENRQTARAELRNSVLANISEDMDADDATWNYYVNGAQIVEGPVYDENGQDISGKGTPVMKMPDGTMFFVEDVRDNGDGTETRTMKFGNPGVVGRSDLFEDVVGAEAAGNNTGVFRDYAGSNASAVMEEAGKVTFTVDNNTGKITINNVESRNSSDSSFVENAVRQMASMYVDYDISWNPTDESGKAALDNIATQNPRGEQYGLNYIERTFDTKDKADVERWLGDNFSRVGSERSLMAMVVQSAAKGMNMSGMDFIGRYLNDIKQASMSDIEMNVRTKWKNSGITGTDAEFKAQVQEEFNNAKAYTLTSELNGQVKATIYAGQNGDPTSFMHELHHTIMLIGDNMDTFTDLFSKVSGTDQFKAFVKRNLDIISQVRKKDADGKTIVDKHGNYELDEAKLASLFQSKDNWTRSDFEFEARLYEAWNRNGKTLDPHMKGFFQRLGEIFRSVYYQMRNGFGGVDLNEEISSYYDSMYGYDKDGSKAGKDFSNEKMRNIGSLLEQSDDDSGTKLNEARRNAGAEFESKVEALKTKYGSVVKNKEEWAGKKVSEFFNAYRDEITSMLKEYPHVTIDGLEMIAGIGKTDIPFHKEFVQAKLINELSSGKTLFIPRYTNKIINEVFGVYVKPGSLSEGILILGDDDKYVEFKFVKRKNLRTHANSGFSQGDVVFAAVKDDTTYRTAKAMQDVMIPEGGTLLVLNIETGDLMKKGTEISALDLHPENAFPVDGIGDIYFTHLNSKYIEDLRKVKEEGLENEPMDYNMYSKAHSHSSLLQDLEHGAMTAEEQFDYIKNQYIGTDKYMMAPNGKATNLNEKQWVQVRTPNFIRWFGDWINDPDHASKILDENGEPLVVYHGTTEDFDVFDRTKGRSNMDIQGMFFSPWDLDAKGYGPNVRAFFLNIKNPATSSAGYSLLKVYRGQNEAGVKARIALERRGHDGVNNDNEEFIAFDSNQIKSATDNNGEFSSDDSILEQENPYKSETFDEEIDDVFKNKGNSPFNIIVISKTPEVYNEIGLHGESIVVKRGSVVRHRTKPDHLATSEEWKNLAENLDKPIGYSIEDNGRYHVFFNIKNSDGHTMMAVIDERKSGRDSSVNLVITAFYKRSFESKLAAGEIKKINQPSVQRHQLSSVLPSSVDYTNNYNTGEDSVNGGSALLQKVEDEDIKRRFDTEETVIAHRSMQLVDGKLYPPMAAVIRGQRQDGLVPGDIVKADENPDLAKPDMGKDGKQKVNKKTGKPVYKFDLVKGGYETYPDGSLVLYEDKKTGKLKPKKLGTVPADYDPYIHSTLSYLNDQFSSAYKRPNLVTVEVKLLKSDLESGYWADKASLPVGEHAWKTGAVSSALKKYGVQRNLLLSQYCQIVRVIPDSEVAANIAELLSDKPDVVIPDNTVPPSLLSELEARGVNLSASEEVKLLNEWYERQNANKGYGSHADNRLYSVELKELKKTPSINGVASTDVVVLHHTWGYKKNTTSNEKVNSYDPVNGGSSLYQKIDDETVVKSVASVGDPAWIQTVKEIIAQNPYDIDAFFKAYAEQVSRGDSEINDFNVRKMLKDLFNEESSKIDQEDWDRYWNEQSATADDNLDEWTVEEASPAEDYPEDTLPESGDLPDWMMDDYEPDVQGQEAAMAEAEEVKKAISDIEMVTSAPVAPGTKHDLLHPNPNNRTAASRAVEFAEILKESKEETVRFLKALRAINKAFYTNDMETLGFDMGAIDEDQQAIIEKMRTAYDDLPAMSQFIRNMVFESKGSKQTNLDAISDGAWKIVAGQVAANAEMYMDLYARAAGDTNWASDLDLANRVKVELGIEIADVGALSFSDRRRLLNLISDEKLRSKILHGGNVTSEELKEYIKRQETIAEADRKVAEAYRQAAEADKVEKNKQIMVLTNKAKKLQEDLNNTEDELEQTTTRLEKEVRSLEARARKRGLNATDTQVQSDLKKKQNQLKRKQAQLKSFRERLKNEGGWNKKANVDKENEILDAIKAAEDAINQMQKQEIITRDEAVDRINELYRIIASDRIYQAVKQVRKDYQERQQELRSLRKINAEKMRMARQIMKAPSDNVHLDEAEQIVAIQRAFDPAFRKKLMVDGQSIDINELKKLFRNDPTDPALGTLTAAQLDRISRKSLDEMTLGEVENLYNTVKALRQAGLEKRRAYLSTVNNRNRTIQMELQQIVMDNPDYQGAALKGSMEENKRFSSSKAKFRTALLSTYNMSRKAQMLDGDKKGLFYDLLIRKKRDLQSQEWFAQKTRIDAVQDAMKSAGVNPDDLYVVHDVKLDNGTWGVTTSKLAYIYLAKNNERNRDAIAYGTLVSDQEKQAYMNGAKASILGTSPEAVKAQRKKANDDVRNIGDYRWNQMYATAKEVIEGTPGLLQVVKAIEADFNSKGFDRVVDLMRRVFNEEVKRESYYLPINRTGFVGETPADKIKNDIMNALPGRTKASVEQGFKISRQDISPFEQKEINYDLFSVWQESVRDQEHTLANLEYVRQLNSIFENKGVNMNALRTVIENTFGKAMMEAIDNHIKEIADPNAGSIAKSPADEFLKLAKGNIYSAYLGFKLSSITNQLITSPAAFLGKVGPVRLASKMLEMTTQWSKVTEKVYGLSSFMESRSYDIIAGEISEAASKAGINKAQKIWTQFQEIGLKGLEWVDEFCVTAGWLAIYEQEIERLGGLETDENMAIAASIADEYVIETQPLSDKTEIAPMFKNKNEAWNIFTQFQSSLNVIWNNVTYDVPKAFKNHQFRMALGTITGYATAGALLALAHGEFKDDDDWYKGWEFVKRLLFAGTTQFIEGTPLVSSDAEEFIRMLITGEKPEFNNGTTIFPALQKDFMAAEKFVEFAYEHDREDLNKALKNTIQAIELHTGLPYSGINELKKIPEVGLGAMVGER